MVYRIPRLFYFKFKPSVNINFYVRAEVIVTLVDSWT